MNNQTFSNISIPSKSPGKDELENIVSDFPESAYARLLLMYQRKKNGEKESNLIEENFLYFKNARWINFLLNGWSSQIHRTDSGHYAISFPEPEIHDPALLLNENSNSSHEVENSTEPLEENAIQDSTEVAEVSSSDENEKDDDKKDVSQFKPDETFTLAPALDDVPIFEPLHTTDYFASQGIKISEEPVSNDKLGKQVKSFTEWLKSMKKIHPSKLAMQNEGIEQLVQTAAERSNTEADIVTEAMADVLLQQGKSSKAIEIYEKLSLIYPAKSTYFAAKIESLKQQ